MTGTEDLSNIKDALAVELVGDDSGDAMMTWGQRDIWRSIQWLNGEDHYFNIPRVLPVPPGRSFADVTEALRPLSARHQTLRTVYPVTPAGPRQVIGRSRMLTVPVIEPGDPDAGQAADMTASELAARSFGAGEVPWRCAIIAAGSVPLYLALAFNHQGTDGWAVRLVLTQLAALLAGEDGAAGQPAWQPLDQVGYEAGADGARRGEASLGYWRAQLTSAPRSMFDFPLHPPDNPRFWKLGMDSPAVAVASALVADRLSVPTSTVLLAASAAILTALNGHDRCVMKLLIANRFDDARRSMVGAMSQDGLFALPADVPDFDTMVRFTYRSSLLAHRYGYYDPVKLADLLAEIGMARGGPVDLSAFFNDVRFKDRWDEVPPAPATPAGWSALAAQTTMRVLGSFARQDSKIFLTAAPTRSRMLQVVTDTAYVPLADTRMLLRGIESLLIASAAGPVQMADVPAVSGVQPAVRGPDWTLTDGTWANVASVEVMLRQLAGCQHAAVFAEPAGSPDNGKRLVAYLADAPGLTARSLRAACEDAAQGRTDVVAPQRYVICEHAPGDVRDLRGWLAMPAARAEGTDAG
jgi:hypothetical protein